MGETSLSQNEGKGGGRGVISPLQKVVSLDTVESIIKMVGINNAYGRGKQSRLLLKRKKETMQPLSNKEGGASDKLTVTKT